MLLQAAERSASMRLQMNHCGNHRVQLSPTMSRQSAHRELGHRQWSRWEPAAGDPHVPYFATVVPVGYMDDNDESEMHPSQFPDPPLYSEVCCCLLLRECIPL